MALLFTGLARVMLCYKSEHNAPNFLNNHFNNFTCVCWCRNLRNATQNTSLSSPPLRSAPPRPVQPTCLGAWPLYMACHRSSFAPSLHFLVLEIFSRRRERASRFLKREDVPNAPRSLCVTQIHRLQQTTLNGSAVIIRGQVYISQRSWRRKEHEAAPEAPL